MLENRVTLSEFIKILQEAEKIYGDRFVGAHFGDFGWDWITGYRLTKDGYIELE